MSTKPADSASDQALAVGRSSGFTWLVRAGFVARGLVYGVIGGFALALALGAAGGSATNQQGALDAIARAPLGGPALVVLAAGLLAYAVWQIGQALLGRGVEGSDRSGTTERIGNLGSGIAYLGLFGLAVKTLVGSQDNQSSSPHKAAAGVLGWPAGQWLVGLAGLILIGVCVHQVVTGSKGEYLDGAKTEEMGPEVRRLVDGLGRVGLVARGLVFGLIGYFLLRTAIDFDPSRAVGIDGALRELARQPYGSWLLGVVAAGLMIFALASLADARYRRL
ncbi:MAG: hypothetical protein QOD61_613 [Solirubrobacteraceae bacterium]|nr:hypothetical protein [Solirubrobacteraceae bacterium]